MKVEFSEQIFEKFSSIKFRENRPSGTRVPCGQTWRSQQSLFAVWEHN